MILRRPDGNGWPMIKQAAAVMLIASVIYMFLSAEPGITGFAISEPTTITLNQAKGYSSQVTNYQRVSGGVILYVGSDRYLVEDASVIDASSALALNVGDDSIALLKSDDYKHATGAAPTTFNAESTITYPAQGGDVEMSVSDFKTYASSDYTITQLKDGYEVTKDGSLQLRVDGDTRQTDFIAVTEPTRVGDTTYDTNHPIPGYSSDGTTTTRIVMDDGSPVQYTTTQSGSSLTKSKTYEIDGQWVTETYDIDPTSGVMSNPRTSDNHPDQAAYLSDMQTQIKDSQDLWDATSAKAQAALNNIADTNREYGTSGQNFGANTITYDFSSSQGNIDIKTDYVDGDTAELSVNGVNYRIDDGPLFGADYYVWKGDDWHEIDDSEFFKRTKLTDDDVDKLMDANEEIVENGRDACEQTNGPGGCADQVRRNNQAYYDSIQAKTRSELTKVLSAYLDEILAPVSNAIQDAICEDSMYKKSTNYDNKVSGIPVPSSEYELETERRIREELRTAITYGEVVELTPKMYRYEVTAKIVGDSTSGEWLLYMRNTCTNTDSKEFWYDDGTEPNGGIFQKLYAGYEGEDMVFECGVDPLCRFNEACIEFEDGDLHCHKLAGADFCQ